MKRLTILFLLIISFFGNAQTVTEPKNNPEKWSQPYEPFRIVGNLYYVGTYDLASYLIVTNKGNILINTGRLILTHKSKQILKNWDSNIKTSKS
jgi:metallo-beta-lactamase class B